MEKGLFEKTGHDLTHWLDVVAKTGKQKHKEIIEYLKTEHGLTYGFANFVALKSRKSDAASTSPHDLLLNQYAKKENLKPLYDHLASMLKDLGNDVTVAPKKDSVSFIRKRQFALIKPATKSRIDLGLKIKDQEPIGKLEPSGPFGAMCTHRIQLTQITDVDDTVRGWIQAAYQQSV
jgi:predicted transport protein